MPICAYCKKESKLTKEHIWPDCVLKRRKHKTAHFSPKSKKVHAGDYIVKDVCAECNNIILSELDSYFCKLYDQYFQNQFDQNEEIEFKYDFNLLARALLKIAYNTVRSAMSDKKVLEGTAPYILGKLNSLNNLSLLLKLIKTYNEIPLKEYGIKINKVPTLGYRSAYVEIRPPAGDKVLCRLVSINSFYFFIFIPKIELTQNDFQNITTEALSETKNSVLLNMDGVVSVKVSDADEIGPSSLYQHIVQNYSKYNNFFKK
ncbi:MAG: hypothetical protein WC855_07405 [Thermodesulfovibrionales bacterium]